MPDHKHPSNQQSFQLNQPQANVTIQAISTPSPTSTLTSPATSELEAAVANNLYSIKPSLHGLLTHLQMPEGYAINSTR